MKNRRTIMMTAGVGLMAMAALAAINVGEPGFSKAKAVGAGVAFAAFLPAFLVISRASRRENAKATMIAFIGGFFYKLFVLSLGIWWGVRKAGYPITDYAIACLSFLIALQLIESLYFWARKAD